jgi:iron complex outermembrane receptor protein
MCSAGVATTIAVMAQPAFAQVVQITDVDVRSVDQGIEVVLQTAGGTLDPATPTSDKTVFTVDINNAQLQLPGGQPFERAKPLAGIANISVTQLSESTIRIAITGETEAPNVRVSQGDRGLVLAVTPATPVDEGEEEEEITVVGTRRRTLRSETPATVDVKTEEEIRREQPLARTVAENLQTLPGIALNRLGLVTTNLNIRGLTGERIGLLVDGLRVPNRQFGPPFGNFDPFRIERIEVLKGPASSIYGADAFGGVVSLATTSPRPDRPFRVRTNIFGGGFGEFTGNAEVQGSNYVVGLTARRGGDAKDGKGNRIPLGTTYQIFDTYAAGRVDISPIERLEARLNFYRQNDTDLPGFATDPTSVFQITGAKNVFQYNSNFSLAYINEGVPGGTNFSVRTSYQRLEDQTDLNNLLTIPGRVVNRGPFLPPLVIPTLRIPGFTSSTFLTETLSLSAQGNTPIGSAILTYGYDFSRDSNASEDLVTSRSGPLTTRTFNGIFLQSSYNVIPELTLAAGVRFDTFDSASNRSRDRRDSAVTFNAGAVYRITPEFAVRGNFAQGFRPPTLLTLFGSNVDGSFFAPTRGPIVSNPDLEPERANNFDIGLNYSSGAFRGGVTYFRNDISNFLGFTPITPRPTAAGFASFQTANKRVILQGVEVAAAYTFSPQWALEGNLTYFDSRDTSGEPLQQLEVLPTTALIRLRYDDGRFSGFLQSRIYGGQGTVLLANNVLGEGSPPATVFDFQVGYRFTPGAQVTLSIENMFNVDYNFPTVNIPAPGIRALIGLRIDF